MEVNLRVHHPCRHSFWVKSSYLYIWLSNFLNFDNNYIIHLNWKWKFVMRRSRGLKTTLFFRKAMCGKYFYAKIAILRSSKTWKNTSKYLLVWFELNLRKHSISIMLGIQMYLEKSLLGNFWGSHGLLI